MSLNEMDTEIDLDFQPINCLCTFENWRLISVRPYSKHADYVLDENEFIYYLCEKRISELEESYWNARHESRV